MFPIAILAGGLATRLRPITESIPKALINVCGRPFLFRQLDYLRDQGISKVVLCTGYLGEQIEAAVGNGKDFGLDVSYSPDGPVLLGTGGALLQALPLLDEQFFVLYGDSFLPCDFQKVQKFYESSGKPALMTILHNRNRWDKSNIFFRNGLLIEYNKSFPRPEMEYIDYGLGILSAELLKKYPPNEPLDLSVVYNRLSLSGLLSGFEVNERFYEIGSHSGLNEAENYFLSQEN